MKYNSYYNTKMIVVYRTEKIYKFRRFVTEEFLLSYMPRSYARTLLNLSYFPSFFGQFLYFFTSLTVDIIIIAHGKMINGLLSFQYGKMLLFIHFIHFLFTLC